MPPRKPQSLIRTELLTREGIAAAAAGLVYSTAPRLAQDGLGRKFFTKGPDCETVFAEVAGLVLADAVGLPAPTAAICSFEEQKFAGSLEVLGLRTVAMWIEDWSKPATNREDLFAVIAVDTWLVNTDRNMGNIVGASSATGSIEFVFIDFEKSLALKRFPTIQSAGVSPRALWPVGDLGRLLRSHRQVHRPERVLQQISAMTEERIAELLTPIAEALQCVTWLPDSVATVASRAAKIQTLFTEVWS